MNKIIKPYNMDEAIATLAGALYGKPLLIWLKLPRERQETIVRLAFDKGVIVHKRGQDERLH